MVKTGNRVDVINILIITCGIVYVASWLFPSLVEQFLFHPALGLYQPWRFLTAAFLHSGIIHLASNMAFLYILGQLAKQVMSSFQIVLIYLLSAWAGSLGMVIWTLLTGQQNAVVGASGAVMGLCAGVFVYTRNLHGISTSLGGLLIINLLIGFVIPNVAWQAHLIGALAGAITGWALHLVAVVSGRIGRKKLGQAIPDVVDRRRAANAVKRTQIIGNALVTVILTTLLLLSTLACYL
ncbi:rhomboid family intramembrane serine protease [Varibaculum sp.]|uniref:rhomboid family intramembrane serine protease n=1 Tax=Varibaculum sp. TaxID=1895474 RepID=UPI0025CCB742|nr:rhomboid family intramembrane serine protease [Varibaculum sp.]